LRERADDIQLLVTHFLDKISVRQGGPRKNLSPEYVTMLTTYPWHGNIRELISCLEWSVVTAGGDQILMPHHLPQEIRVACIRSSIKKMPSPAFLNLEDEGDGAEGEDTYPSLEKVRWDTEQKYLQDVLKYCQGDIKKALTLSGLSRSRFYALLTKYQIPT
jgi:DNA-binding NtrC family response regulator